MKKSFSIIALLVAMVFVFTACSGPATPTLSDRWQDGEFMSFDISLADVTNVKDFMDEVPTFNKVAVAQVKPDDADGMLAFQTTKEASNVWNFEVGMMVAETYFASKLPANWKSILDDADIDKVLDAEEKGQDAPAGLEYQTSDEDLIDMAMNGAE